MLCLYVFSGPFQVLIAEVNIRVSAGKINACCVQILLCMFFRSHFIWHVSVVIVHLSFRALSLFPSTYCTGSTKYLHCHYLSLNGPDDMGSGCPDYSVICKSM
ncbi:hypothetical protein VNO77_16341 [Canavalia gladiata]|uniref:Uncharacterized protein n=1 Tax=Canavalia gladiata TaxID=3824 RepID=A0AAN9M1K2_CANGL